MLLIRFMLVMAPVVLLINGYTKGDWWEAALFALSVAVGLTPEMLPMIVTSTLGARGGEAVEAKGHRKSTSTPFRISARWTSSALIKPAP
ncbi:magnesium-transporting ATPase MgtA [Klebsiella pneumoniae]|uniref:Magnesium-transporting ATPase MgtA n=1 Tax=Klebsiella pneumoniae TaxID=573 RepID=A0A2X3CNN8_KLEPN|nr:magnesium-transporting ATPase MgtA [Klebsiella pneumoniae]